MNRKSRDTIEIIGEILNTINHRGSITMTKIMYETHLSYTQLEEYISIIRESDLLKYDENEHTYTVTDRGLCFLKAYQQIEKVTQSL
jgi:predicted transcriptional regulator